MTILIYELVFREIDLEKKYVEKNIITMITECGLYINCPKHAEVISFDAQFKRGVINSGTIEKGMDVPREARPESPGGTGDPVLYEDED